MAQQKGKTDSFFDNVYEVVRLIPRGRVTSYGSIAHFLGTKGSSRMVGWALSAVTIPRGIPAHRVLNRNGVLTGKHHFKSPNEMQKLLEKEGVKVKDDRVVDFAKRFWDPSAELL